MKAMWACTKWIPKWILVYFLLVFRHFLFTLGSVPELATVASDIERSQCGEVIRREIQANADLQTKVVRPHIATVLVNALLESRTGTTLYRSTSCDIWNIRSPQGHSKVTGIIYNIQLWPQDVFYVITESQEGTDIIKANSSKDLDLHMSPSELTSDWALTLIWVKDNSIINASLKLERSLTFSYYSHNGEEVKVEEKKRMTLMGAILLSGLALVATLFSVYKATKFTCCRRIVCLKIKSARDVDSDVEPEIPSNERTARSSRHGNRLLGEIEVNGSRPIRGDGVPEEAETAFISTNQDGDLENTIDIEAAITALRRTNRLRNSHSERHEVNPSSTYEQNDNDDPGSDNRRLEYINMESSLENHQMTDTGLPPSEAAVNQPRNSTDSSAPSSMTQSARLSFRAPLIFGPASPSSPSQSYFRFTVTTSENTQHAQTDGLSGEDAQCPTLPRVQLSHSQQSIGEVNKEAPPPIYSDTPPPAYSFLFPENA